MKSQEWPKQRQELNTISAPSSSSSSSLQILRHPHGRQELLQCNSLSTIIAPGLIIFVRRLEFCGFVYYPVTVVHPIWPMHMMMMVKNITKIFNACNEWRTAMQQRM